MGEPTPAELAFQTEIHQLRERISEMESQRQIAVQEAEERNRKLLAAVQEEKDKLAAAHATTVTEKNRLQALMEALPIGVALLDDQGGHIAYNRQIEEVWGGAPPPIRSVSDYAAYQGWWPDTGQPVQPEEWASARAVQKGETVVNQEIEIQRLDGRRAMVLNSAAPIRDALGRIAGSAVAIWDITDLKRFEQSLKENEAVLRSFFDSPGVMRGIAELVNGRILHVSCNAFAAEVYGVDRESIAGKPIIQAGGTDAIAMVWASLYEKALATRQPVSMEYARPDPQGGQRWLLGTACHLGQGPSGHPRFGYTCLDVTDRKKAEEEVRLSNAVLEAFFSASPGILNILDEEFRYLKTDPLTPTYFDLSREQIVGRSVAELAPEFMRDYGSMMREVIETGRPRTNLEVRSPVPGRSGEMAHWLASYFPVPLSEGKRGIGIVAVEITVIKKAEERLRQAQKLESLGLLAGGVAHDFNNLLVGVIGNAGLALDLLPADHPAAELVQAVMKTGEQAAHLTRQMLAYSGKGKFLLERLDVSGLVREISELIRPSISKKATLHFDLGQHLPPIEADRGQVQQILMNLVINASEAMGSHDGLITIRTETRTMDALDVRLHPEAAGLQPGEYVALEVRDTGCGMDESIKAKIFDPFFSTKFTGRGLGLAAVAGIMRGHKGAIFVSSEPGKGSMFTVLFPVAARPRERRPGAAPLAIKPGSGVILVIDDEPIVRQLAQKSLERYGYTVLVADGGPEAIEIFKRHPGKIDLAIVDLSMPGMSGEETLLELRKIRTEVKVLVSSGYSEADAMTMFHGQHVSGFIQKPYTPGGIAEKVKLALA